jgi:hypothetical protein
MQDVGSLNRGITMDNRTALRSFALLLAQYRPDATPEDIGKEAVALLENGATGVRFSISDLHVAIGAVVAQQHVHDTAGQRA